MEPAFDETPADELTLMSVDERIKQATDSILRRVEELCALLRSRTEMESAGNSEASVSRRNRESSSTSRNRNDSKKKNKLTILQERGLNRFAQFPIKIC